MTDTMTPEQRHRCMAAIKGKDTKPEMIVRRYLHSLGYRYGLHNRKLPGSPDLVLRRLKTVIFIHGCFWHGHEGCRYYRMPKSNLEFWKRKISRNRERDVEARVALEKKGWNVITVWECALKKKDKREETLEALRRRLERLERGFGYQESEEEYRVAAEPEMRYGNEESQNESS